MTDRLAEFEAVYRRHVDLVVRGDTASVLADMDPAGLPGIFTGVQVPRGPVGSARILDMRLEGERAVGECVYVTESGSIGLRSGWRHEGRWLADRLANIEPPG
ncbi:hypothetical protein K8Z61_12430 [Nocardioides sp. TRM66260-LWL]|uniref:hypothetical protein n=1 Tax=Nocardioides sp. TRM66260-LWL TaxID=2874478 RepID=UPI001CC76727|nr:hypothetical protein [Nocardioides sp. TRM66260-LWL]MBZ5735302.1 hypothetical protein [Nocardioides sp. TRM66260-LWL]